MVIVTATDPSGATDTINGEHHRHRRERQDSDYRKQHDHAMRRMGRIRLRRSARRTRTADAIEWSLAGEDAGDFEISDDGVLTFKKTPNFEKPCGRQGRRTTFYKVTVQGDRLRRWSDGDELDLEVTVTDEDEPGKVTLSQPQPQVGRGLEADGLNDPDAGVDEDEKWQWARGTTRARTGPWTDIDKATIGVP